jgi:hypothetical protein
MKTHDQQQTTQKSYTWQSRKLDLACFLLKNVSTNEALNSKIDMNTFRLVKGWKRKRRLRVTGSVQKCLTR